MRRAKKKWSPVDKVRHRAWRRAVMRRMKTLTCPACGTEFTQNALIQYFCSEACREKNYIRPWKPHVRAVVDEFLVFLEKHSIPLSAAVHPKIWYDVVTKNGDATDDRRARLAEKLKFIMDRFRRGFFVMTLKGIVFQNPPWTPFCPVDQTYCRGAIMAGDCPRKLKDCAYSVVQPTKDYSDFFDWWKPVLEARGVYEITLSANKLRYDDREGFRPIIGFGKSRYVDRPDARSIREHAGAGESDRGTTADGPRL